MIKTLTYDGAYNNDSNKQRIVQRYMSNDEYSESLLNVVYFPDSEDWTYHSETTPALIVCRHSGCVIYKGTVWDLNESSGGSGKHGSIETPYYLTAGHIYRIVKNQKRREK